MSGLTRWILADTETTGLKNPKVCEVAWIEVDAGLNILDSVTSLIDPQAAIEPGASGVHNITNDMVEDAPTMDEFFYTVKNDPLAGDVILVCHNVQFDIPLLRPYIPPPVGKMCTMRLARKIYPEADNHKLNTLRYYLNLDGGKEHSAGGDVAILHSLLSHMVLTTGLGLHDLLAMVDEPIEIKKMAFGKHKGLALKDVPKDWFSWYLRQENTDPDLAASIRKIHPHL